MNEEPHIRIVCWVSNGAASTVAAKKVIERYGATKPSTIMITHIKFALTFLLGAAVASAWWSALLWPQVAQGLIWLPAIVLSLFTILATIIWIVDNWNK